MSISTRGSSVIVLRPLRLRRHRREDQIHIAAGFQPEDRAAVVNRLNST